MHQIEPLVDLLKLQRVGDHRVDLNFSIQVPVNDLRYVGAAARAAERRALPDTAGDELERSRGDLLAGLCDTDDDRYAPAAVAGLERLAHHVGVAGAVEGEVRAAVGEGDEVLDDIARYLGWVDEIGHAESTSPIRLGIVDVDADDLVGADHLGALNDVQPDAAETKHDNIRAGRDLGRIGHRTDTGGDAAADVAALVEGCVLANFRDRDFRQHGKVRERRTSHVVIDRLSLVAE